MTIGYSEDLTSGPGSSAPRDLSVHATTQHIPLARPIRRTLNVSPHSQSLLAMLLTPQNIPLAPPPPSPPPSLRHSKQHHNFPVFTKDIFRHNLVCR
ncbi:hypothetical protein E2C01_002832 [Portunus trituberculatus]|uniref:Uncharacterized protein n=1 Tax=Portunus trituberculatus TaxID=210409 RepID=A0A5B7CMZ2_PORTR|nr:hypothetical protein [Portunus trituberculatus]